MDVSLPAIDGLGETVEFFFSESGELPAAKRFLRKALDRRGWPARIVIDSSQANQEALISSDAENRLRDRSRYSRNPIRIRRSKYLKDQIERDHWRIKRRVRMLGFKLTVSAEVILPAIERVHMMRKRQGRFADNPRPSIAAQFELIAPRAPVAYESVSPRVQYLVAIHAVLPRDGFLSRSSTRWVCLRAMIGSRRYANQTNCVVFFLKSNVNYSDLQFDGGRGARFRFFMTVVIRMGRPFNSFQELGIDR